MEELRIAILGFGSANRALARMLLEKSEPFTDDASFPNKHYLRVGARLVPWRVVSIVTRRHGRVCVPLSNQNVVHYEINVEEALRRVESRQMLDASIVIGSSLSEEEIIGDTRTEAENTRDLLALLGRTRTANVVVEAIPSNPSGDGEPAISFTAHALRSKMHVVSANKSPLAHCNKEGMEAYWTLQQLARDNGVAYQHESAVMDGVPIFSLLKYTMPHAKLTSIRGCLNSTTTMILTRMEGDLDGEMNTGETFQEALDAARHMGIVEEDESLDTDGYDAAVKLRALLVVLTSSSESSSTQQDVSIPTMDEISRDSIRSVTPEDIRNAYADGRKKYRLVASAELVDAPSSTSAQPTQKWKASVELQCLPPADPLYNLTGSDSSVTFHTDVLGPVTMVSSNPMLVDTAYGLFADIVRVASESTS